MSNYVKSTNFTAKDSLPSGDANKVIRGSEFDTEFDALATAVTTKADLAGPTFTGTATFADVNVSGTVTAGTIDLNGGALDNVTIGGSTPAAGTFTSLTATGTVNLSGLSITFSQLDAGAVTLSSETFSDVDNQIPTNAAVIDYLAGAIPGIAEVNDLTAVVTWADVPDANITQSSVTQHQAALSIAASQLSDVTATATELNYVDGVTSNIQTQIDSINPSPTVTATASGALTNGDTVVVNSDGTVSVVSPTGISVSETIGTATLFESADSYDISIAYDANAQKVVIVYVDSGNSYYGTAVVGTVSGTSISFGTPVVFESATISYTAVTYDSNAQKVVIAYRDSGNSNYGTAIVGTVSGTSISFGSATVFESANSTHQSIAYDTNAQKVVIAYKDEGNSSYGTAIVGTVSGTSISFGTAVVFESANSDHIWAVYDSNAQKIVISYRDIGNSYNGTAIVGTVSGTSISFGSATVFETADTQEISSTYDANAQKVVIAYRHGEALNGDTGYGTAIVGTVSGTSISFGSAATFEGGGEVEATSAVYDSGAQRVVIAYRDAGNSNYGTFIVGTVSGTSISFGSPSVFESAATEYIAAVYDSNAQRVVVSYRDAGNSNYGTALVYQTPYTGTNLTAENYIGISDAAYSDTTTATIQIVGSVDDAQSGLTAGQKYFVQTDGSLGLTAGDPEVFAGTAVSATKLIVKG